MNSLFQILNMLSLIATIDINYLSIKRIFNSETMTTMSAKFQNQFTPAEYAFSIWELICY